MELFKNNIKKLYAFSFFQSFLILQPIIIPYWQEKNLSLQQVFSLQAIFGFTLIVLDVPAGYVADLFGRKKMLMIGCIFAAFGFQILSFGRSFSHFVLFEVVLAIGYSLQSGCDVAMLYDSIEKLEIKTQSKRLLGTRTMFNTLGEAISSLIGGALAVVSLSWPVYATAVTAWIPLLIAISIFEPESKKFPRDSHLKNLIQIKKTLFNQSKFLTFAIIYFVFYGFATYCAVWFFQPFWKEKQIPIALFGYLYAIISFTVAGVSRYAYAFEDKLGMTRAIILISTLPVIGYFGMGLAPGWTALLFMFAFPLCGGLNRVLFQDAINSRIPSEMRATTNSIGSFGTRTLFIVFGPLLGGTLDREGSAAALKIMGFVYFVGLFVIAWPLLSQRKSFTTK